jgi:hypothetical protein
MNVDLSGPELAEHLAKSLTDLEFELLVRERIRAHFKVRLGLNDALGESHNECKFYFRWNDKSIWCVSLGATYNDAVTLQGEVLSTTVRNCATQWDMQNGNKLSLLLSAPKPDHGVFILTTDPTGDDNI